jgi:hypothetical protein
VLPLDYSCCMCNARLTRPLLFAFIWVTIVSGSTMCSSTYCIQLGHSFMFFVQVISYSLHSLHLVDSIHVIVSHYICWMTPNMVQLVCLLVCYVD